MTTGYLKKDFCEFRCAKRKLDVCKNYLQWDQQILPSAVSSFPIWRGKLEMQWPGYFERWDKEVVESLPAHAEKHIRVEFVEGFLNCVDNHSKTRKRSTAKGAVNIAGERHATEAEIATEIRNKWNKLADLECVGLLPLVQMHGLHFAIRDRSKEINTEHRLHPADGTLYFQIDFKEHDSLPVGPEESGDYWYAHARLGVTILRICVSSIAAGTTYHTYCSTVSEQSGLFTVACLLDLFAKLDLEPYTRAVLWADVGPHFRCSRLVGFWLSYVLRSLKLKATDLFFFPEHHGKGIIDGHFGRMRMWLLTLAKSKIISTLQGYTEGMGERAMQYKVQNPTSPNCVLHAFSPPVKSSLPNTALRTDMLRADNMFIKNVYFWSSKIVSGEVMMYAHAMAGESSYVCARPCLDLSAPDDGATGPWKE